MTLKEALKRLLYRKLQDWGIVPKNPFKYSKLSQKINLIQLYSKISGVAGCIVELGVAQGMGLATLAVLSISEDQGREIYGFDTFEGLPEGGPHGFKGQFSHSYDSVKIFLQDSNIPTKRIHLVKGDIRETLKNFSEPIAFLHIDLDLYEGYKAALDLLWDQVSKGGIVLFDDYAEKMWPRVKLAVDEFVASKGLTLLESKFAGKFYLIK